MKKIGSLLLVAGITLSLSACGGGGGGSSSSDDSNSGSSSSGTSSSVDATAAKEIFENNCSECHGKNLEGGRGPNLQHIGNELSKDEILDQIKNGGGGMPGGLIKGDDAETVATWLASKK